MQTRTEALSNLLSYNAPLEELALSLKQFPWDSDSELVVLKPHHLSQVINRYLTNDLTEMELEDWANVLESREDIAFLQSHEGLLQDIIFCLANPLLTQPITHTGAQEMLDRLEQ